MHLLAWSHMRHWAGVQKTPAYRKRTARWTHNLAYVKPTRSKPWKRLSRLNPRCLVARSAIPIVALYNGLKKDKEPDKVPDISDEIISDLNFTLPTNPYGVFGTPVINRGNVPAVDNVISLHHSKANNVSSVLCQQFENGHNNHENSAVSPCRNLKTEKSSQTDPVFIKTIQTFTRKPDKCTSTRKNNAPFPSLDLWDNHHSSPSSKSFRICRMLTRKKHRSFSYKFVPNTSNEMLHDALFCGSYKPRIHKHMCPDFCFTDNGTVAAAPTPTEKEIERR